MKKNYLILIILIQLNSYLTNGQISVMTFNIRYDNPKDNENWWEYRKSSVVQMFNFYSPEIIGIQEGLYHQLKYIKNSLPEYDYIGVGRDDGKTKGEYAAIFYKKKKSDLYLQKHIGYLKPQKLYLLDGMPQWNE